ncbi:MAG TPA: hypothetical protein VIT46_09590 [Gaiellaceae bacterium]
MQLRYPPEARRKRFAGTGDGYHERVARRGGWRGVEARSSYVSPAVVDAYLAGRTLVDFRGTNGRAPRRNPTLDERALVSLLRTESR